MAESAKRLRATLYNVDDEVHVPEDYFYENLPSRPGIVDKVVKVLVVKVKWLCDNSVNNPPQPVTIARGVLD